MDEIQAIRERWNAIMPWEVVDNPDGVHADVLRLFERIDAYQKEVDDLTARFSRAIDRGDTLQAERDELHATLVSLCEAVGIEIGAAISEVRDLEAERDAARQWAQAWKRLAKRKTEWLHMNAHLNATLVMRSNNPDYLPPTERQLRDENAELRTALDRVKASALVPDEPERSGTYEEHCRQLEAENERLRDLLNLRDAELANALDDARGLRTSLHDALNELHVVRWGKHAQPPHTAQVNAAVGQEEE